MGKVASFVVLAYGGIIVVFYALQTALIFPRGGSIWRTPASPPFNWTYEEVALPVEGETTRAWYVPAENSRGTLLFSHGNAGTMADRLESIGVFRDLDFNVLIYDYGGYGESTGSPSEKRCYADIRAAWGWLTGVKGESPGRIVLFGRSLGSGPTTDLARDVQSAAVILESAFLSTARMGQEMLPFIPVRLLIRHRFDNEKKIGGVKAPILIIHSPEDDIIPYRHGRKLFELAPEPKTFLEIHGNHNEGWYESGMVYTEGLARFLDPLFPR